MRSEEEVTGDGGGAGSPFGVDECAEPRREAPCCAIADSADHTDRGPGRVGGLDEPPALQVDQLRSASGMKGAACCRRRHKRLGRDNATSRAGGRGSSTDCTDVGRALFMCDGIDGVCGAFPATPVDRAGKSSKDRAAGALWIRAHGVCHARARASYHDVCMRSDPVRTKTVSFEFKRAEDRGHARQRIAHGA